MDVGETMLISLTMHVMNRLLTFSQALVAVIAAANQSPPCEIVVLDYSSTDGLDDFMAVAPKIAQLAPGNFITYRKWEGEQFFNVSHAQNLAVQASHGEVVFILSADALPDPCLVAHVRARMETEEELVWMVESRQWTYGKATGCRIAIRKSAFIFAGGFDERMCMYGPEDKDFCLRLHRLGWKMETYPRAWIPEIPTPDFAKLANYPRREGQDIGQAKRGMSQRMRAIFEENVARGALCANEGKDWSKWQ